MATLEKIRGNAGLLVAVLGIALLAFIVGDLFNIGSAFGRDAQDKMIVINGEAISHQRYEAEIEMFKNIQEQYSGRSLSSDEDVYQLRQYIYDMLVRGELINAQSEKVGLTVSDQEVSDLIFGKEPSPFVQSYPAFMNRQTGTFDRAALMAFATYADSLENVNNEWRFVKISVRDQRLQEKYGMLLTKALAPNSLDAKFNFESAKTSADFAYVTQSYVSIPDSLIEVTKKDLKNLYSENKNRYKQPEKSRGVKYIALDVAPTEEDFANEEKVIADAKAIFEKASTVEEIDDAVKSIQGNRFINAFVSKSGLASNLKAFVDTANVNSVAGPYLEGNVYKMVKLAGKTVASDTIVFRQIGFPLTDNVEMVTMMDSVMNEIKNGKDIDEIAKSFGSSAPVLTVTQKQLVSEFDAKFKDEIFALPTNQVAKLQSKNGIHLIVVTRKSAPVEMVKIAEINNPVYASTKTTSALYNEANQFVTYNNTLEKFEKAAEEKGYVVHPTVYLNQSDQTIGGVRRSRDVVRWAFENKPGDVKFFECEDKIVIAVIENKIDKGYRPEELVEKELRLEVLNNKKAEKIIADWKAKSLTSLGAYTQEFGLKVDTAKFVSFNTGSITGIGMEPVLEALTPIASENQLSEPVKGNNGVYIYNVYNKTTKPAEFDAKTEMDNLKRNSAYRVPNQALRVLMEKAEIEDNRILFY